jgi:cbb3-type cytochrome oxidase maturation protein
MSAIFILLGFSIMIAGSFLAAFIWSVSSGQYEDDYTPSIRMLFDDTDSSIVIENPSPKQSTKHADGKILL